MVCPKCGHKMSADSDFCMNCGSKVEKKIGFIQTDVIVEKKMKCKKCGNEIPCESVFCPSCGTNLQKNNKKILILGGITLFLLIGVVVAFFHQKNLKSPIEGVSKKVYEQGKEYLNTMESASVKKKVMLYVSEHKDENMDELSDQIEGVDFHIDLGRKPTEEEKYYSKLIEKFWESRCICYAHDSLIAEYENSNETAVQKASSLYKGIVAGFEDKISEAKDELSKAKDKKGMKKAYDTLDNIWEGNK
ncbi:MAG: zinc ribbon domain-containing protein [Clostridium sp.]|nr:zinc ribbon domain-containing protein [Clostridium sp.]